MEWKSVTQSRKGAKGWDFLCIHPVEECLVPVKFHFFAPLRLCVTSHPRI